jgi:lipopolysaccharide export system ATP-binding protein
MQKAKTPTLPEKEPREASTHDSVFSAQNLKKVYGKRVVVENVSIEVKRGSVVGLLGPNGAGKTTVFYMMVGLVFPAEGKIFLGPNEITERPLHERAKMGIGYLAQEPSLFRKLSVFDNVAMAFEAKGIKGSELTERTYALLKRFGLEKVFQSSAAALSGGERRRCEIARCLAIDPQFVLLDEPFAGIDPIAVGEIQDYIRELKEMDIGVLITDHNVRETLGSCDQSYLMRSGSIFFSGTPEEIVANADARKFYLGEDFKLN